MSKVPVAELQRVPLLVRRLRERLQGTGTHPLLQHLVDGERALDGVVERLRTQSTHRD